MPKSKLKPAKRGTKSLVRSARSGPEGLRQSRNTLGNLNRGRPKGGRPPRFPGRTGGR